MAGQEEEDKFEKIIARIPWMIAILIALWVVVFLLGLYTKIMSSPSESFAKQLWDYLDSDFFNLITVSLFLPIIVLFLDTQLKFFANKYSRQKELRIEHAKELNELKKKRAAEERERRLECIQTTSSMWQELMGITNRVVYLQKDDQKGPTINKIFKDAADFVISTEQIINMWSIRFPPLDREDLQLSSGAKTSTSSLFISFINLQLSATCSVAEYLKKEANDNERRLLQSSLERIADGIDAIAHHTILLLLKYYVELLDPSVTAERKEAIQLNIDGRVYELIVAAEEYLKIDIQEDLLPNLEDTVETSEFREAASRLSTEFIEVEEEGRFSDYEGYDDFKAKFDNIATDDLLLNYGPKYSKAFIKRLARELSLKMLLYRLWDVARFAKADPGTIQIDMEEEAR